MRSSRPHCFLFGEHGSEEDVTSRWPTGSNLLRNRPTEALPSVEAFSRASLLQTRARLHVHTDA